MTTQTQSTPTPSNPNVGTLDLVKSVLISLVSLSVSRSEDGSIVLSGKDKDGNEKILGTLPPFVLVSTRIVTPPDLMDSPREWEIVRFLGSGDPSSNPRVWSMKEGGRGRPMIVVNGTSNPDKTPKTLRTWIGIVESLVSKGYLTHTPSKDLDVWTPTPKVRSSLVPKVVGK